MSKNLNTKIGKVRAFLEEGNTITSWDAIHMFDYTRLAAGVKYLEDNYGLAIERKWSMRMTELSMQSIGLPQTLRLKLKSRTSFFAGIE